MAMAALFSRVVIGTFLMKSFSTNNSQAYQLSFHLSRSWNIGESPIYVTAIFHVWTLQQVDYKCNKSGSYAPYCFEM